MKTFAALGAAFLFLLLTVAVPRLKAQEREDDRDGAKSGQQQDDNKQPTAKPQEDRSRQQSTQEPRANRPDQERSDQEKARQGERNESRPAEAERGKRIPDDRFRASFGPHHTFRLRRDEVINNSRPVVTYGGYSFELLEPWPAGWSFDDACYIDYLDDQYYLLDPVHPGIRIALVVVNVD